MLNKHVPEKKPSFSGKPENLNGKLSPKCSDLLLRNSSGGTGGTLAFRSEATYKPFDGLLHFTCLI